jgi:hypothetical protein
MAGASDRAVLPPDAAARLADFARTCKAAARAVSLYPAGHPAIVTSLARIAESTAALTRTGPFTLQVHAQELLADDAAMPKPDPAVTELAALLHRHLIGRLTLNAGADAGSWRTLLLLLARAPEEVRADGGIARLWETAGGPSIEIIEIDYAEVLREKAGSQASIASIIAAAVSGGGAIEDETIDTILEAALLPAAADALMKQMEPAATEGPQGAAGQTTAFLNLMRNLVARASRGGPERLASLFSALGKAAGKLSADAMNALLATRVTPEALAGTVNVVNGVVAHMPDESIAGFITACIVAERGASERLAHAFRALVPEYDRQRRLLALARDEVAESGVAASVAGMSELWQRVEGIMASYSDANFVSADYARDLSMARTQPVDVERASDDPPERIVAWLTTVNDTALRTLDHDLLTDLLRIEVDPLRWRDIAETVVAHADDLIRVGYFDQALRLIQALIDEGAGAPERAPHAAAAIERVGRGSLMKHMPAYLRTAEADTYEKLKSLCHAIGEPVIVPLAEGLAAEQDARSRRRLRDILVGFGPRGAESVRPLMNAGNWEVRRTAAFLLREFGGSAGLKELVPLLADAEPLVRREAVQGLVMNGSREASAILLNAILSSKGRSREALLQEVLSVRDERAAPLFAHALRELEPNSLPELYATGIEVLGSVATTDSVDALKATLAKGQWWAPFANRKRWSAAVESLRRIGSPAALTALRDAAARGPSSVRAAARAALEKAD